MTTFSFSLPEELFSGEIMFYSCRKSFFPLCVLPLHLFACCCYYFN